MMIQDTRLQERPDGRAPVRVPGYYTFHKPKDENCHGLLTIVRRQIPAQHIDTARPGVNSEVLTVKIWINEKAVLIHNLYRTKDDIDLSRLLHSRTPAFIGCDINAHHLLWHTKSNREGHKIMEQLERLDDYVILNENQQATRLPLTLQWRMPALQHVVNGK